MGRFTKGVWSLAAAAVVFQAAVGSAALGLALCGLPLLVLWSVGRALIWKFDVLSQPGMIAALSCVLLPMIWGLQSVHYWDQPLPLTFSARELPLSEALRELGDAGFTIERDARHDGDAWVRLPSRRPSFSELDAALHGVGIAVHITFDFLHARLTDGPHTTGRWSIRPLPRYGRIRWVQLEGRVDGLAWNRTDSVGVELRA